MAEEDFRSVLVRFFLREFAVDAGVVQWSRYFDIVSAASFRSKSENRVPVHREKSTSSRHGLALFLRGRGE